MGVQQFNPHVQLLKARSGRGPSPLCAFAHSRRIFELEGGRSFSDAQTGSLSTHIDVCGWRPHFFEELTLHVIASALEV